MKAIIPTSSVIRSLLELLGEFELWAQEWTGDSFRVIPRYFGHEYQDPVFRKLISANLRLNFTNPGLKFNRGLDCVFQTPINLGLNRGLNLIDLARSINSLIRE